MMTARTRRGWLAVLAATLMVPTVATAQLRVETDGRARDANPQVGSGGMNDDKPLSPYENTIGNSIVTGNVTGNAQFRGNVGYGDQFEFRGGTAGRDSDLFIARSSGVPEAYAPPPNPYAITPFYGDSRAVAPPVGYQRDGYTGGYVPASIEQPNVGDARVGTVSGVPVQYLGQSGAVMPSASAAGYGFGQQLSAFDVSPLYGVRELGQSALTDQHRLTSRPTGRPGDPASNVARMQQELRDAAGAPTTPGALPEGGELAVRTDAPFEAPNNAPLNQTQDVRGAGQQPLTSTVGDTRADLPTASQQSTQYAELARRLDQYKTVRDARIAREGRAAQAEGQQGAQPQQGGVQPRPTLPQGGEQQAPQADGSLRQPMAPRVEEKPRVIPESERPAEPLQIKSLAEGVAAPGLAKTLADAETRMQEGKYLSALEAYQVAETVAPNNPLVRMGKANALLGASYFARAEGELRAAFLADPALLLAQYDLGNMVGQRRIDTLVRDLKIIARTEESQPQAVFLLAYVMYNTNNAELAQEYLTMAEQRSGGAGKDAVYAMMREYWKLPAAPAAPQDNK